MTIVYLSESARETVGKIAQLRQPESTVFVIMHEAKTDTLMAIIVSRKTVDMLNTVMLGEVLPGIEVYGFGLEKLPPDMAVELCFLPLHNRIQLNGGHLETSVNYLLEVLLRPGKKCRQSSVKAS